MSAVTVGFAYRRPPAGGDGVSSTRERWCDRAALALVAAAYLALFSQTIADPDLWGHLRFGQDVWQTGRVARPDPYSYLTGGQAWVNHEWLSEAIFAGIYAGAGAAG